MKNWLAVGLYFASIVVCAFGATIASQLILGKNAAAEIAWLQKCLLIMIFVTIATWCFMRRSGQSWNDYGVRASQRTVLYTIAGLMAGMLVALMWAGIVRMNIPFRIERNPGFNEMSFLLAFAATIGIGVGEEVGYRSYGFAQLRNLAGPITSVFVPTVIFVLVHILGGVPLLAGILVVGSSSILYGTLMLTTRSLPFVAAFHIGNNLIQDALLRTSNASLFRPLFESSSHTAATIHIWIGIAVINLVCAYGFLLKLKSNLDS